MKKKMLILGTILMLGLFILTSCSKKISNSKIKELIPEEVINYNYNGEQYTSTVEKVKIVRQNTEKGDNTTYCEVELKDENITRLAYLCLYCKYYKKGGWNVESWDYYEDEVLKEWNKEAGINLIENKLLELEYTNSKLVNTEINNYNKNDNGYISEYSYDGNQIVEKLDYDINEKFNYLDLSGKLSFKIVLGYKYSTNYYTGVRDEYPIYYSTNIEFDTSDIKETWNLDGNWYAEIRK